MATKRERTKKNINRLHVKEMGLSSSIQKRSYAKIKETQTNKLF